MRKGIFFWSFILIAAFYVGLCAQEGETKKEEKIPSPADVTREFIDGILARDAKKIEKTFSFEKAYEDFTDKADAVGIDNPWNLKEFEETLMLHFLIPERIEKAKALAKKNTTFDEKVNKKLGVALAIVTEYADENKVSGVIKVKLMLIEDKWRIIEFPDFYPLDAFEILTGRL